MHGVEETETCLGGGGALLSIVLSVDGERQSLTEISIAQDGLVDTGGLTSLQLLNVGLKLERTNEIIGSEVSALRGLVVISDGDVDGDTVNFTCLELNPGGVPVLNDVANDLVGLIQTLVLFVET